jgi:hypothetical protein
MPSLRAVTNHAYAAGTEWTQQKWFHSEDKDGSETFSVATELKFWDCAGMHKRFIKEVTAHNRLHSLKEHLSVEWLRVCMGGSGCI